MNQPDLNLPVPVLQYPHWRVNLRPEEYDAEAIPSLGECLRIIQHNQVRLRGWSYPHLSNRDNQVIQGSNWIGSWTQFMGHREYWRFYQSKQFIHLFSVREATEQGWAEKLRADTVSHLSYLTDINWDEVPGFISLTNFLYCVTEIVEFAARLCQAGVYRGVVDLNIQLRRIGGFVLTTTWERAWSEFRAPSDDTLGKGWSIEAEALLADSAQRALEITLWFSERFGWLDPSVEVIRKDINDYLEGRT
jgi:hypothetical protein